MGSIKFLVLAILAIATMPNAASSAKVKARSLSSSRETVLPDTKEYPFVTAIYILGCSECIGTIIGDRWVLCSARCAGMIQQKEHMRIIAGVSDLNDPYPKDAQNVGIDNLIIKDNSTTDSCNPNNVALLHTDQAFDFSKPNVRPINLPSLYTGAVIESSYNVPYWEYRVCPYHHPIFHPLVVLYAKRVEPPRCRPKGHDPCSEPVVCIESGDHVGPLMGPLTKADKYNKEAKVLDAISMDLNLVSSDGYNPDLHHDAQAPITYEILEWIHTIMNPVPEPIG